MSSSVTHFCKYDPFSKCDPFFQLSLIFQSVTHFFKELPILLQVLLVVQVPHSGLNVSHFFKCEPFL